MMSKPHRLFTPKSALTLTPSPSKSHERTRARIRALQESYQNEITQAFHVFDEKRTGTISLHHLKLLIRALGFRVTQPQVLRGVLECKRKRKREAMSMYNDGDVGSDSDSDEDLDINLDLVLDLMEDKYNKKTDANVEMKINFRLFDADNKGYINARDIQRVIDEINTECAKMAKDAEVDGDSDVGGNGMMMMPMYDLREEQIMAMIDEFDGDQDSVLNFQEFKKIMQFSSMG